MPGYYDVTTTDTLACTECTDYYDITTTRWLVEQGLTSHLTQFRSFRRQCFYKSDDPTNSIKALKEGG